MLIPKGRRLIGKLIYLTVTRLDITFVMGVLSRYKQSPHQLHWIAACRILRYLKGASVKGFYYLLLSYLDIVRHSDTGWAGDHIGLRFTTSYFIFVGGNDVKTKCCSIQC